MKKIILTLAIIFVSFVNIFAQEVLKTDLRLNLINNLEIPEKFNCEFIITNECKFIIWNDIENNVLDKIPLLQFIETHYSHNLKVDSYKTTYGNIVKIYYTQDKFCGIYFIDSSGVETLYVKK
jgi:hypothetical protein